MAYESLFLFDQMIELACLENETLGFSILLNVFMRNSRCADMNLDARVVDDRRIEVLASGLPLYHGAQIAVDATLVSPLTRKEEARARAHRENGAALADSVRLGGRFR